MFHENTYAFDERDLRPTTATLPRAYVAVAKSFRHSGEHVRRFYKASETLHFKASFRAY